MYRGTTPTIIFNINSDLDFEMLSQVWVTFKSQTAEVTKDMSEIKLDNENRKIYVRLSQTETLQFNNQCAEAQIRFLTTDGTAFATNIVKLPVNAVLKGGIIHGTD